jgi:pimeloyl-ACP methyl ester carboxylesterase
MQKLLILIIGLVCTFLSSFAQSADPGTGNWIGMIEGTNLPIYFRITGDSASGYKADWNSPNQKAMGLPCKTLIIKGDSLFIETAGVIASFRGRFLPGLDSVTGSWRQNGQVLPLGLRKMHRPQTPHPPFPYRSDSIEYDNMDKTVHLGATLTYPNSQASRSPGAGSSPRVAESSSQPHSLPRNKFPVVILITGSGQEDRDETLLEHKPFAVIADYLTRRGLAVLRVDDRATGKSKGDLRNATTADFADDVLASIRYLKTRDDIDTTRIGLIGHSEGGLIAPIVYTRWPHINLIIMLAGPGVPGWEVLLRQQTDPVRKMGQEVYDAYYPLVKEKMKIIEDNYGQPDSVTLSQVKASYTKWKAGLSENVARQLQVKNVTEGMYGFQVAGELKPWLRYFYHTDPVVFLEQVKCPVLALNGAKDLQVDPVKNIPAIRAALVKGGNTQVTTHVLPGLNHLFQHTNTGEFSEYAMLEESFAPEALQMMGDWIGKIDKLIP